MSTHTINLDDHKELFRDHDAFESFVAVLRQASQASVAPIFAGQQLLGGIASPDGMKEFLSERFLRRLSEKPELLAEITDRLEHDEIVE
ncbi:MAG: hypothetical protein O3C40_21305 [Planctomycetota bacterium]|nr:hypothetical protein [Planctomycetota bacterium]